MLPDTFSTPPFIKLIQMINFMANFYQISLCRQYCETYYFALQSLGRAGTADRQYKRAARPVYPSTLPMVVITDRGKEGKPEPARRLIFVQHTHM